MTLSKVSCRPERSWLCVVVKGHAIQGIKSLRVSLQDCAYRGLEPTSFVEAWCKLCKMNFRLRLGDSLCGGFPQTVLDNASPMQIVGMYVQHLLAAPAQLPQNIKGQWTVQSSSKDSWNLLRQPLDASRLWFLLPLVTIMLDQPMADFSAHLGAENERYPPAEPPGSPAVALTFIQSQTPQGLKKQGTWTLQTILGLLSSHSTSSLMRLGGMKSGFHMLSEFENLHRFRIDFDWKRVSVWAQWHMNRQAWDWWKSHWAKVCIHDVNLPCHTEQSTVYILRVYVEKLNGKR